MRIVITKELRIYFCLFVVEEMMTFYLKAQLVSAYMHTYYIIFFSESDFEYGRGRLQQKIHLNSTENTFKSAYLGQYHEILFHKKGHTYSWEKLMISFTKCRLKRLKCIYLFLSSKGVEILSEHERGSYQLVLCVHSDQAKLLKIDPMTLCFSLGLQGH